MNSQAWKDAIAARVGHASQVLGAWLPDLIVGVLVAVAGVLIAWLLSRLVRFLVRAGLAQLERLEWFQRRVEDAALYRRTPAVLSAIVFWSVLLLFLVAALEVAKQGSL